MPKAGREDTFVVSCAVDKVAVAAARKKGVRVLDKEIILTGLLRRDLDFKSHELKV